MPRLLNERIILYRIHAGDTNALRPSMTRIRRYLSIIYLKVPDRSGRRRPYGRDVLEGVASPEGRQKIKVQAFLYQVARNVVVDFYRRRGR